MKKETRAKVWQRLARVLWLLPILFFFAVAFNIIPAIKEENRSVMQTAMPLVIIVGYTIWAWIISETRYLKVRDRVNKPIMLLFIPISFVYMVLFETSFNYERFIRESAENAFWEHMKFHIFNDTLVFIVMFGLFWLLLQKIPIGRWSLLASLIMTIVVQQFLTTYIPEATTGEHIASALVFVWLLHATWFTTSLFLKPDK